jgi:hypothetical protein
MELKEAIEILREHNKWRRGDESIEPTNPTLLGWAIQAVINEYDNNG